MAIIKVLNGKVSSSTDFDLTVGTTDVITLDSAGLVGIGTTDPSQMLHLYNGTVEAQLLIQSYDDNAILILDADINGSGTGYDPDPRLQFKTGGVSKAYIYYDNSMGIFSISPSYDPSVSAPWMNFELSSGYVGIGTTNPTSQLHTYGTANYHTHERSGKILYVNPNYSATDLYGQVAMRGADSMGLSLSTDEAESKQLFIEFGGFVGIGTSNPARQLEIRGVGATDMVRINSDSGNVGLQFLMNGTNKGYIWGTADLFAIGTGTYAGSIVFDNDNIGIGVTNATQKLTVEGNISGSGFVNLDLGNSYKFRGRDDLGMWEDGNYGIDIMAPDSIIMHIDSNNNGTTEKFAVVHSQKVVGTYTNTVFSVDESGDVVIAGTTTMTGDLTVGGTVTAQEFHAEFVSSSIIYSSGSTKFGDSYDDTHDFTGSINLLGSTQPILNLFNNTYGDGIVSTIQDTAVIRSGPAPYQYSDRWGNGAGVGLVFRQQYYTSTTLHDTARISTVQTDQVINSGKAALTFQTGDGGTLTEKMRITHDGNVGIGTTIPARSLHVYDATNDKQAEFESGDAFASIGIKDSIDEAFVIQSSGLMQLGFTYLVSAANVTIDTSGNVGIGTTTPGTALDVRFASTSPTATAITPTELRNLGLYISDTSLDNVDGEVVSGIGFGYNNEAATGIISIDEGGSGAMGLAIVTGTTSAVSQRFRVDSAGLVGIGTGNPLTILDIHSATPRIQITDTSAYSVANLGGGITFKYIYNSSGTYTTGPNISMEKESEADGNYGAALKFTTRLHGASASEKMRITGAGYVGIGMTTPSVKFNIEGGGHSANDYTQFDILIDDSTNIASGTAYSGIRYKIQQGAVNFYGYNRTYANGTADANVKYGIGFYGGSTYDDKITITKAGNVGIGNTSPTWPLTIEGNVSASGYLQTHGIYEQSTYPYTKYIKNGADAGDVYLQAGSTGVTWTKISLGGASHADVGIKLFTAGTERFTIDYAGNSHITGSLTVSSVITPLTYLGRNSHHAGHLVGGYQNIGDNALKTTPIFTMGSSYNPDGETLSNMYGIGHTLYASSGGATFLNATDLGTAVAADGWGMYVAEDGNARIFLDGTNGSVYHKGNLYTNGSATVGSGLTLTGDLDVTGNIRASGYKAFYIDNPQTGEKLTHMALEGPEPDVYFRGQASGSTIDLPDYWEWLVDHETITVQVTPIDFYQQLFVKKIEDNTIYIKNEVKKWGFKRDKMKYHYIVHGRRKDIKT